MAIIGSGGGLTNSTGFDSSGANLLVYAAWGNEADFGFGPPTDTYNNTWVQGRDIDVGAFAANACIWYVDNPIVGAAHVVTSPGGTTTFVSLLAISGGIATSLDQINSNANASDAGPATPGSILPSQDNEILVVVANTVSGTSNAIGNGFTKYADIDNIPAVSYGGIAGYLIQTTATAANPSITSPANMNAWGACIASFKLSGGPPPTNPYTYSKLVTIDFTQCGSSDSTNFKAVIRKVIPELRTVANGGLINNTDTANGQLVPADFQVYTDLVALTKANFEIPYYNQVTGEIEIWYNNPLLDHTNNTLASLAFGAPSITTYQGSAPATFASPYKLVAHLPNGITLSAIDSSAGAHNGTITGAIASAGNIDGAASFAGGTDKIDFGSSADFAFAASFTISCWVKTSLDQLALIFGIQHLPFGLTAFTLKQESAVPQIHWHVEGATNDCHYLASIADGNWHHIVGQWNNSLTDSLLYIDSVLVPSGGAGGSSTPVSTVPFTLGQPDSGAIAFDGLIDEVHAINALLSADWILAEYNNQKPNSTFLVLGPLVPPIPVVTDMAYTQSLQLGLPMAILQNIVYALPVRACFVQCTAAVEVSNIIDSGFATLTNANTVGAETAATWIRCTTGNATITVKSL